MAELNEFTQLVDMTDEQLDYHYTSLFGHKSYHMSREGYIRNIENKYAEQRNEDLKLYLKERKA